REARVVDGEKALAVGMIVPLRAVVFAAVQHGNASTALHGEQVFVDEVVAPAIQLVARRGRPVELEETRIERMVVGKLGERRHDAPDLLGGRLVKDAVDVVIVIVDEQQPAAVDEPPHVLALYAREADGQMSGEIQQWIAEHLVVGERGDDADRRDGQRRIARDAVDDVRRNERGAVPVARFVLRRGEDELAAACRRRHGKPLHRVSESCTVIGPAIARRARTRAAVAARESRRRSALAASAIAAANDGWPASASIRNTSSESTPALVCRAASSTMRTNRRSSARAALSAASGGRPPGDASGGAPASRTLARSITTGGGAPRR